jgi:hypothetical protein
MRAVSGEVSLDDCGRQKIHTNDTGLDLVRHILDLVRFALLLGHVFHSHGDLSRAHKVSVQVLHHSLRFLDTSSQNRRAKRSCKAWSDRKVVELR